MLPVQDGAQNRQCLKHLSWLSSSLPQLTSPSFLVHIQPKKVSCIRAKRKGKHILLDEFCKFVFVAMPLISLYIYMGWARKESNSKGTKEYSFLLWQRNLCEIITLFLMVYALFIFNLVTFYRPEFLFSPVLGKSLNWRASYLLISHSILCRFTVSPLIHLFAKLNSWFFPAFKTCFHNHFWLLSNSCQIPLSLV